jgi:hypothetical protein
MYKQKKVAYFIELHSRNVKYKVTICTSHKACFLSFLLTHIRSGPCTYIVSYPECW